MLDPFLNYAVYCVFVESEIKYLNFFIDIISTILMFISFWPVVTLGSVYLCDIYYVTSAGIVQVFRVLKDERKSSKANKDEEPQSFENPAYVNKEDVLDSVDKGYVAYTKCSFFLSLILLRKNQVLLCCCG